MIELPTIRQEGFDAMRFGAAARYWVPEYREGFCFVPYAPNTTERANFLQGCCYAYFGAPH